jgi:hypothetical protein
MGKEGGAYLNTISINSPIKLASWVVREKGLEYGIPTQVN